MKPYPETKATGLEWLPRVPAHWEVKPFKRVATERCVKNIGLKETRVLSLSYGKIVVRDMSKSNLLPASFETYQIVEPGNIIFRLTDLQNDQRSLRIGLVEHDGIITSAYLCVEVHTELLPQYLAYLLRVYDLQKMFYQFGGGVRQSIGYDELKLIPILIPPFNEQTQIVSYLAEKNREIEGYIKAKQRMIERLDELKSVIISEAVTGRLT